MSNVATAVRHGTILCALLSLAGCAEAPAERAARGEPAAMPVVEEMKPLEAALRPRLHRTVLLIDVKPPVNAAKWEPPAPYRQPEAPGFFEGLIYTPLGFVVALPLIPVALAMLELEGLRDRPPPHFAGLGELDLAMTFAAALGEAFVARGAPSPLICAPRSSLRICMGDAGSNAEAMLRVYMQAQFLGSSKQLPDGALAISMAALFQTVDKDKLASYRYGHHWRWRVPVPARDNAPSAGPASLQALVDDGLRTLAQTLAADLWQRDEPTILPFEVTGQVPALQILGQVPGSVAVAELRPLWLTVAK